MRLFILGYDVVNDAEVVEISVLGNFMWMYQDKFFCNINVYDYLEEAPYIIL